MHPLAMCDLTLVSVLAALGPGFVEFTEAVLPFVLEGLRNVEEEEVGALE